MVKRIKTCFATYLWDGLYVVQINKGKPFIMTEDEMWAKYDPDIVDWVEYDGD